MEEPPCAQVASRHAVSLLASLNLQRERAQFCDCVVRQRQTPGQLHPAHRCVLAASSPVLAAILSSTGALVELQPQCLSDAVLSLLLDFIYTGTLPYSHSQHLYYNLLTAASYLQMDELQEALRAWQQTEVKAAYNTNASTGTENRAYEYVDATYSKTVNSGSKYLPLSLERGDHQYSANVDTCDDVNPRRTGSKNGANYCSRKDATTLSSMTPQDLTQNIPCTTEVHRVSGVDKEVQKDQFHSAGTEEGPEKTVQDRRSFLICTVEGQEVTGRAEKSKADNVSSSQCSSSSSSSSSPHPCRGAVPVIRHSSRASALQLAVPPPCHDSQPANTDSDSIVEGVTRHKNEDYRNNKDHTLTHQHQSDILKQDYFIGQNDDHMSKGLSYITNHNERHAHCDSFKNLAKHLRDDLRFDDFPSKHQRLDCSDSHSQSEQQPAFCSQDLRAVVPLPVQDSDTGGVAHGEGLYSEGDEKEEHSYTKCPAEADRQDSDCDLCEPRTDWYPSLRRAEKSTEDTAASRHSRDTTMMDKRHDSPHFCQPVSTTPDPCLDSVSGSEQHTSVEAENMSCIEITEPHMTFTVSDTSDPTYSVVGPSYRGHLQYHCLLQEETHLSHAYSGHKHSQPCHPDHSGQSSDDEEVGTSTIPGHSPVRQHFAPGTTNQVLLLDISAKPAELLVADAFSQKETAENRFGNNDRQQWNEAPSVGEVDSKFWVAETNVEERKCVGKEQSSLGPEVIHKAGIEEGVSNPKDGPNQTITMTVCAPRSVPDSAQASVSSALSVCMPSTRPANISAHLLNPVRYPFQCSLCDRSFSQRGSLNRHVRSHLGVRPFPCPRCPMTFSRQYRVTEHMRVHQRCVLGSDFQQPPSSI